MGAVKVFNDNVHPFEQEFKGDMIKIAPKEHVMMDWYDAVEFRGQYYKPEYDATGQQKAQSFKMIRIDGKPPHLDNQHEVAHTCQQCGDELLSESALDDHTKRYHLGDLQDQELARKLSQKRRK